MIAVDPKDRSTWVNLPEPPIASSLQAELKRIGGTIPPGNGELSGQPVFRLAFGQTEREFSAGRMRIRFRDSRIPRIVTYNRIFVSQEAFSRFTLAKLDHHAQKVEDFTNGVLDALMPRFQLLDYLKKHELSTEYLRLEDVTLPERERDKLLDLAPKVAPVGIGADWLFLQEIADVTDIGRRCWYIMRWRSAEDYESPKTWELHRHSENVYLPEHGVEVPFVDMLGPYPKNGYYTAFAEIANYERKSGFALQTGEDEEEWDYMRYSYREPSYDTVIVPVMEQLDAERRAKSLDREYQEKLALEQAAVDFEREHLAQEATLDDFIKDCAPAFAGKERKFQQHKENSIQ